MSEACATDAEDLGFDRGHRTLRIIGKGNKPAVISQVPRSARTIDLALGERSEGPIRHRRDGQRLDRRTGHRWVRSIGKRAGLGIVHPHMLRAAFIMAALDAGYPSVTSRSRPATRIRGRPPSTTAGGRTSTAMPPMSWWPSWPAVRSPPGRRRAASLSRPLRLQVVAWSVRPPTGRRAPGRRRRTPTCHLCPIHAPRRGDRG